MISLWLSDLWAASLKGGLALLAAWLLCHIPRVPPVVRCWIWRAAYGVLLVSFVWTTPLNLPLRHAAVVSPTRIALHIESTTVEPLPDPPRHPFTADPAHSTPAPQPAQAIWPRIAFSLWATFVIAYAARIITSLLSANRLRRGMLVNVPQLVELCRTMNIRQAPAVRSHPSLHGPLLVGLWHPTIVLPESMLGTSHLRLILAHELAHLKRLDLLWNWLPTLAMAILPFHPLVWLCNRQWRLTTEAACDAETLAVTAIDPAEYGRVLVNVALSPPPSNSAVLAVAVATGSGWILKKRLSMMANITAWNRRRLAIAGLIVAASALLASVPWRVVAQQPQPTANKQAPNAPAAATASATPAATPAKANHDSGNTTALGQITDPRARIRSLISGTVTKVNFSAGQAVKKGDVLVEFDSTAQAASVALAAEIVKASDEQYKQEEAQYKVAVASASDVTRARLQLDKDRDVLRQRQAELDATRIVAPFDGVLASMSTSVGSTVIVGDPIAVLFDPSRPTVEFTVPVGQAQGLKPGQQIEIDSGGLARTILGHGEITAVGPEMNGSTGTISIRAKLTSTNGPLAPGQLVNVSFHAPAPAKQP